MRPTAKLPKLTRRSRILIAIALAVVVLLLVGPRLIDGYVDWLWFGELGYRSVFTTVLVTRLLVFLVAGVLVGGVVFASLALAYRTRPVFVPTNGPNDPVARYRTAVMTRLRLFGIGIPVFIGIIAGIVAQSYWVRIQLFLHGGSFGVKDPQFGKDLGFYAFDLPFYRLVLSYLFVAVFLALVANLLRALPVRRDPAVRAHRRAEPLGAYPAGLAGRDLGAAQGGRLLVRPLRAAQSHPRRQAVHRRRLHRHQRRAAGQADPAGHRADLRGRGVLGDRAARLADPGDRPGAAAVVVADRRRGWPLIVEQISVKPNAAQKESEYISRSITATRQAYGLTDRTVTYRDYSGDAPATAQQVAADRATTSNIRLLDPNIVSPAFTQFQQGKNFYYFPDQLAIDRYRDDDGNLRDYVVAARELNPDRLIDNQRDWINRHTVYTHGNGFIASPANTVRGHRQRPQPERRLPRVPGQRRRRQRRRHLARARRRWTSRASTSGR